MQTHWLIVLVKRLTKRPRSKFLLLRPPDHPPSCGGTFGGFTAAPQQHDWQPRPPNRRQYHHGSSTSGRIAGRTFADVSRAKRTLIGALHVPKPHFQLIQCRPLHAATHGSRKVLKNLQNRAQMRSLTPSFAMPTLLCSSSCWIYSTRFGTGGESWHCWENAILIPIPKLN